MKWMDIKTAPKDGSIIWLSNHTNIRLGYWPGWKDDPEKVTGRCWADHIKNSCGEAVIGLNFAPINWMPIPLLPIKK